MKDTDIAWLAGYFEGEGSLVNHGKTDKARVVVLTIGSTDRDVLERCLNITGLGVVRKRSAPKGTNKQMYNWRTESIDATRTVLELILPYLGHRRKERALEALERLNKPAVMRAKGDTHCINGHELSGGNVYEYESPRGKKERQCRECRRDSVKRHRAKG